MRNSMRNARRAIVAAASLVIAGSLVGSPLAAAEDTPPSTSADAKSQMERLQKEQREIEAQYKAENDKLQRLMGQTETKRSDIVALQAKIDGLKSGVGNVALAQYKSGSANQAAQLMTAPDAGKFLTNLGAADKLGSSFSEQIKHLQTEESSLAEVQRSLQADQAASQASRDKLAGLDKQAKEKVNQAQAVFNKLTDEEKKRAQANEANRTSTTPSTANSSVDPNATPANNGTSYTAPATYSGGGGYTQPAITPQGNAYDWGNCTYWVYIRRLEIGRPIGSFWGNAAQWPGSAAAAGFTVDNTPEAGAAYVTFGGYYGHVMFVEKVNGDGTMLISEMNWNWMTGVTTYRTIPAVGTFIH